MAVMDPETMQPVPADGETMGEIMFRGNITMKGYLKNPTATQEAFAGGWFHSGDLAVLQPDGYVKIKDRSKDIIISGGENISSIEVEDVLYRHPAVLAAAVVAQPDAKWGETPCAFVELKDGADADRARKSSRTAASTWPASSAQARRLRRAAQDLDRQDPEVHAARAGEVGERDRRVSDEPSNERDTKSRDERSPSRVTRSLRRATASCALTLNRPEQFNALSRRCSARCRPRSMRSAQDESARVVVIAGAGKAFCAGHDLKEMRANAGDRYYQQRCSRSAPKLMLTISDCRSR